MKINDLLHNFCCRCLEVHLSGSGCVKQKCKDSAFCRLTTKRLAVNYAGSVDTSRITLSNRVLDSKHVKYKIEEEKGGDNRNHRT